MISRAVVAAGIAVLMVVSSVGTYMYLGSRQSKVAAPAQLPGSGTPSPSAFDTPGTLFVTQAGAIYSFSAGRFHQLTPVGAGWAADRYGLRAPIYIEAACALIATVLALFLQETAQAA